MYRRQLVLAGLKRQYQLLDELITGIQWKSPLELEDCLFCFERTSRVAKNLKKLREIHKKDIADHRQLLMR
ncbi:MAG: hypothetical protein H6757_02985 [Candidatus Omnitrophica bacterium]|nr:hypothetical protein [Candidatus Omnitrophota bacterium]